MCLLLLFDCCYLMLFVLLFVLWFASKTVGSLDGIALLSICDCCWLGWSPCSESCRSAFGGHPCNWLRAPYCCVRWHCGTFAGDCVSRSSSAIVSIEPLVLLAGRSCGPHDGDGDDYRYGHGPLGQSMMREDEEEEESFRMCCLFRMFRPFVDNLHVQNFCPMPDE